MPDRLRACLALPSRSARPAQAVVLADSNVSLNLIRYAAGDTEGAFEREIERFASDMSHAAETLQLTGREGRPAETAAAAHALLGFARMVGDDRLAAALGRLEASCAEGTTSAILSGVAEAVDLTAALRDRLLHPGRG